MVSSNAPTKQLFSINILIYLMYFFPIYSFIILKIIEMVFYKLFLAPLNIMYVVNIFPSHQMVFENLVFNSCVSIALS